MQVFVLGWSNDMVGMEELPEMDHQYGNNHRGELLQAGNFYYFDQYIQNVFVYSMSILMCGVFIANMYMITLYGVELEKMNYILSYVIRNVKYLKVFFLDINILINLWSLQRS